MTDKHMVALAARQDIFRFDSDTHLGRTILIALSIGVLIGIYFSNKTIVMVPPEYFENLPQTLTVKLAITEKKEEKNVQMIAVDMVFAKLLVCVEME